MRAKISALVKKADSTIHEAEKMSCLRLAEKLCTKYGFIISDFMEVESDTVPTEDDFVEFWDTSFSKAKRTIHDLYNFKSAFYYSNAGNLTFFEDDIRITIIEDDYDCFNLYIDGMWFNDINSLPEAYAIAYIRYQRKTIK